jgi:nitrate reductase gamma subunit
VSTVIFSYAPYFAVFGFLAARMYQWGILRDRAAPATAAVAPATEAALLIGFITLAGGHLTTALAPSMMRVLLSDPDRVAVIETIGLVGALLFAWGVAARLRRRVQAWRRGGERQAGPALVLALLLAVCLSGIYLTVSYRWVTVWYAYILVPYTRSLVVMEPVTGAIVASPWALKQHTLLFFALLAAWPAAGLRLEEIFPLRAVARRFADAAATDAAPEVSQ